MSKKSPGVTLKILALLLAVMVVTNFGKAFSHHPGAGFVLYGKRLAGNNRPFFGLAYRNRRR